MAIVQAREVVVRRVEYQELAFGLGPREVIQGRWRGLLVRDRTEDGDGKVREQRRAFIELQPAHHAMVF